LAALDTAANAAARVQGEPSLLPRPLVTEKRLAWLHAYIMVDLAIDGGYKALKPLLRAPGVSDRNKAIIHVYLARAAVQDGAIDRACHHAGEAHRILTAIGSSGQLVRVSRLVSGDLAPFTSVRAVKELDEQVRTGATSRYVLCRSSDDESMIHLRTCQYARRGGAWSWARGERLDPVEVAGSPLRNGYKVCTRCLPR
jgi:hypothetical protein